MSEKFHNKTSWATYNEKIKMPRPLCVEGVQHVESRNTALDFGAGSLLDTQYLLDEAGFSHVHAIDADPDTARRVAKLDDDGIGFEQTTFEEYQPVANSFDFITAQNTLGFISKERFDEVIEQLINSLTAHGVIAANFFGDKDDWNTPDSGKTCVSIEKVQELLAELEILKIYEHEHDKGTALGNPKHWHEIEIIARKN